MDIEIIWSILGSSQAFILVLFWFIHSCLTSIMLDWQDGVLVSVQILMRCVIELFNCTAVSMIWSCAEVILESTASKNWSILESLQMSSDEYAAFSHWVLRFVIESLHFARLAIVWNFMQSFIKFNPSTLNCLISCSLFSLGFII